MGATTKTTTKTTTNGHAAGDRVLAYLSTYRGFHSFRWVEVERVTPTLMVVEGIRYRAEDGVPVSEADRWVDGEGDGPGGDRRIGSELICRSHEWAELVAREDRPAALARAKKLNDRIIQELEFEAAFPAEVVAKLSGSPEALDTIEDALDTAARVRAEALAAARARVDGVPFESFAELFRRRR